MEPETTTDAPVEQGGQSIQGVQVDDQGMAVPQPEPSEPAEAEPLPSEDPQEQTDAPQDEPSPDDTSEWMRNKGIDPNDPEAVTKLAKSAREAERAMHNQAQKRSELERAANITQEQLPEDATPEVRDNVRVRNLELRYDVQQWKLGNPDKLVAEPKMVEILSDPLKKQLVQEGYLSLDDVYNMARGSDSGNEASLKSQGGRQALQTLAQKQQAAVPRGNAVTSGTGAAKITPQNVDQLVAGMTSEEYRRNLPAINRALQG